MSSSEFAPDQPELHNNEEAEQACLDEFFIEAKLWQSRLDQFQDNEEVLEALKTEAVMTLNQKWPYHDRPMLFVGRMIRPEFDEDNIPTDEDVDGKEVLKGQSDGIETMVIDGRTQLTYSAIFDIRQAYDPLRRTIVYYLLQAPIEQAQFHPLNPDLRGELSNNLDINDLALEYSDNFRQMITSRTFLRKRRHVQLAAVEDFLRVANNQLHDPDLIVPMVAVGHTKKLFQRTLLETPYGFTTTKYDQPARVVGWYMGLACLETNILQNQRLTKQADMVDAKAGLCAVVEAHMINGQVLPKVSTVLVPLGYCQDFHTGKLDQQEAA